MGRTLLGRARTAALLVVVGALALATTATLEASGTRPASPSAGTGSASPQQVLPPASQTFTPAVADPGITLTAYAGGSAADLAFELQLMFNDGARAFATVDGELVALLPGAPEFVNAPFEEYAAGFPDGIPAGTILIVVVDPYPPEAQQALDQARAAWVTAGSADYDMTMTVSCFCLLFPDDPGASRVTIEVRDGVVVRATPEGGDELSEIPSLLRTVEELFDEVQDAIDERAARIDATYAADGHPLSLFIDRSLLIADEEIGYTIHDLTLQ